MSATGPVHVGTHTSLFTWQRTSGRRYVLRRLARDVGQLLDHPWNNGADVEVRLDVHAHQGRLFVGGVQVLTAPKDIVTQYGTVTAPPVTQRAVNTDLMRLVPLGKLEQEALQWITTREGNEEVRDILADDPEAFERLTNATEKTRRGRPSKLTPALLEVVAKAHREGGRASVQAVQRALDRAGYEGNGPGGETTWDQAAKAVARARRGNFLPPSARRSRNS